MEATQESSTVKIMLTLTTQELIDLPSSFALREALKNSFLTYKQVNTLASLINVIINSGLK